MSVSLPMPEGDVSRPFTLTDFFRQFEIVAQPGMMKDLIRRMPGMSEMIREGEAPEVAVKRVRGMLDSMTEKERAEPDVIDTPRRRRIAAGAGVQPQHVNYLLKQFDTVRALMKQMVGMSLWQRMKLMTGLGKKAE
jgi:signal recognition particle subunit SRP54